MAVTLLPYDDNKTIYIYTLTGDWTWDEFLVIDAEMRDIFEMSVQRVDLIFDLTLSSHIPMGASKMIHRAGQRTVPPSHGLVIIVKPPAILPILLGAMRRLYPKTAKIYHIADTREKAINMIQMDRELQSEM